MSFGAKKLFLKKKKKEKASWAWCSFQSKLSAERRRRGERLDYLEMNFSAAEIFLSWLLRAFEDYLFILDMML